MISVNSIICDAINQRRILRFFYGGGSRLVEPFCYGLGTSGNDLLRGYQVGGYSQSQSVPFWRLFKVEEITSLSITDDKFSVARPDYNPNDEAMQQVYCRF